MKLLFKNKLLLKLFMPYFICGGLMLSLIVVLLRLHNTVGSGIYSDWIFMVFVFICFLIILMIIVYSFLFKIYKHSTLSIYKNKIRHKVNNYQNILGEMNWDPKYRQYNILSVSKINIKKNAIIIYGDIELEFLTDKNILVKTKKLKKIYILKVYDELGEFLGKIV